MKKLITYVLLLFLAGTLFADNRGEIKLDKVYEALQINHSMMAWTDFAITTTLLNKYKGREMNPIARLYIDKKMLAVTIILADNVLVHYLSTKLFKKNKTLAYITLIGLSFVRAYIFYRNLRELDKFR